MTITDIKSRAWASGLSSEFEPYLKIFQCIHNSRICLDIKCNEFSLKYLFFEVIHQLYWQKDANSYQKYQDNSPKYTMIGEGKAFNTEVCKTRNLKLVFSNCIILCVLITAFKTWSVLDINSEYALNSKIYYYLMNRTLFLEMDTLTRHCYNSVLLSAIICFIWLSTSGIYSFEFQLIIF